MNGMNMHQPIGAMDVIVMAVVLFLIVFVVAWVLSPALRRWIERPKYRFMDSVSEYDQSCYSEDR